MAGADNQVTYWDLALEDDDEAKRAAEGRDDLQEIPPRSTSSTRGSRTSRRCTGTRSFPGVVGSTALDSFRMMKPANTGMGPPEGS